jgi:ABC-type phosphate transport system permease subunit
LNKIKKFIKKLQDKPEKERKVIMQIVLIVSVAICVVIWLFISYRALNNLTSDELKDQMHFNDFKKAFDENKIGN